VDITSTLHTMAMQAGGANLLILACLPFVMLAWRIVRNALN
jgi:hypothetical protein